jgi:hypothetical protein
VRAQNSYVTFDPEAATPADAERERQMQQQQQ